MSESQSSIMNLSATTGAICCSDLPVSRNRMAYGLDKQCIRLENWSGDDLIISHEVNLLKITGTNYWRCPRTYKCDDSNLYIRITAKSFYIGSLYKGFATISDVKNTEDLKTLEEMLISITFPWSDGSIKHLLICADGDTFCTKHAKTTLKKLFNIS